MNSQLFRFVSAAATVLATAAACIANSDAASPTRADDELCGVRALTVCGALLGRNFSESAAALATGDKGRSTSLLDLSNAATAMGLQAQGVSWKRGAVPGIWDAPGIVRIERAKGGGHFVVLAGASDHSYLLVDFPSRAVWITEDVLRDDLDWDGVALHVAVNSEQFPAMTSRSGSTTAVGAGAFLLLLTGARWVSRRRAGMRAGEHASTNLSMRVKRREPDFLDDTHNRVGFTIVELLISIGVLSLLMALFLPAVQRARESSRRSECVNRLHQIGVACHAFETARGRFPGGTESHKSHFAISVYTQLLPWVDQAALYAQVDLTDPGGSLIENEPPASVKNQALIGVVLPIFQCPTDSAPNPRVNHRVSRGNSPLYHSTFDKGPDGAHWGFNGMTAARISDGLSNTTAFAEKLAGDRDSSAITPWRDSVTSPSTKPFGWPNDVRDGCRLPIDPTKPHRSYGGYAWVIAGMYSDGYNHVLTPNSRIPDCTRGGADSPGAFTARSLHPGGVNVLLADGAVRFVSEDIHESTWRALGSINGNEVVGAY